MPVINEFSPNRTAAYRSENAFKVFIAYENQRALARAEELQSQLSKRCRGVIEMESNAWNFALLAYPRLRKRAAQEAAESDMIIIAALRASDLPPHVHSWIKSLATQKQGGQAALVALLDPAEELSEEPWATTNSLRRTAETSGLDFFCNRDEWH